MKKFISLMIGLVFTFGLMVNANAAEVSNFEELKACVKSETETLCKIVNDDNNTITMNAGLRIVGEKTVDLNNGKLISAGVAFLIDGTSLRVEGPGTIESSLGIAVFGTDDATKTNYSVVYIGKGVTINDQQYALPIFNVDGTKVAYGVDITIDGATLNGVYGAMYINGLAQNIENTTNIKIMDGSTLKGGVGIYAAGYANWTIGKATIEGVENGIGLKAGKWVIDGAYIKATGEDSTPTEGFSNGIEASGAAIQVEANNAYAGEINLEINSGKFESLHSYAFYEYLDLRTEVNGKPHTPATDTKVVNIAINGGDFIAPEKAIFGVSQEFDTKFSKFITGGTFIGNVPAKYVADNYEVIEEDGKTTVRVPRADYTKVDEALAEAKKYAKVDYTTESYAKLTKAINAVVRDLENSKQADVDKMASDITAAIKALVKLEETVTAMPEVDTTEKVEEIMIGVTDKDATDKVLIDELEKSDIETAGINTAIVVNAYPVLEEEIDKDVVGAITGTVKDNFNNGVVGGFFDVSIFVFNRDNGNYIGALTDLKKSVKLSVVLPEELKTVEEGYTRTYYIIRYHDDKADIINTTLSKDGNSLEFESDKFSMYAIAYEDVKTEEVASTYDGVGAYMAMGLISLVSLAGASLYLKKEFNK